MAQQDLMVCKTHRAVAIGFVEGLHRFSGVRTVRNIGMAMEIDFVKSSAFRNQFDHNTTSFSFG
jgi:hypothetical protein